MIISIQHLMADLKKARKSKRLTQKALSKKIRVPQSHISKIEKGSVDLHLSSFVEMARSLELEVMLVPRDMVPVYLALQREKTKTDEQIPLYQLKDEDDSDV